MKKKHEVNTKIFIDKSLTEALYYNVPISIVTMFLVSSIIVWQFYYIIEMQYLFYWYLFICIITIYRIILFLWYKKTCLQERYWKYHYWLFVLGSSSFALLTGILGSFLMPNNIIQQAFILVMISGIVAGAVLGLTPSFLANILFIYIVTIPVLIWELLQIWNHNEIYIGIFFAMLLFCIFSSLVARRGHSLSIKHLELEYNYKGLLQRVSELKDEYKEKSNHDLLTGLYNHQFFINYLNIEIKKTQRKNSMIAIIMLDIDSFKKFNDIYGHLLGDYILQSLGNLLNQNIRKYDIACRYGGEEFIIMLPETSVHSALERAELIRIAIKSISVQRGSQLISGITVSFGVASYPKDGQTTDELIQAVDKALYQSKNNGGDCISTAT